MEIRGLGQADDSPITKTAAWLATATTVLMKEPVFARLLADPLARAFAEGVSPVAAERLAELDDPTRRYAWIREAEETARGCVGVCVYRKLWFRDRVREALEEGATQLVILGAGCDTLSVRLAELGMRPTVFELDRPAMTDLRAEVLGKSGVDLRRVRQVPVDFDNQDFRTELARNGYDAKQPTVFVAEGVLEYLEEQAIDDIFAFVRAVDDHQGVIVHSFIEDVGGQSGAAASATRQLPGEPWRFAVDPAEIGRWHAERGLALRTVATAREIENDLMRKIEYPPGHPPLGVTPFLHFAVAGAAD